MLFQWIDDSGSNTKVVHDHFAHIGQAVRGIRHNNRRPDEIVLTREELLALCENPAYAAVVLSTMVFGKRPVKGPKSSYFKPMTDQEYLDDKGA